MAGLLVTASIGHAYTPEENQKVKDFLTTVFLSEVPTPQRLWVSAELKPVLAKILDRPPKKLSYRYWQAQGKTVWLLDELGKEREITTAVVIQNQQVQQVKVVVYRESRGGEVQVPWFTEQFIGATQQQNWQKNIDSISGATLSVNALKKQTELALFLDSQITEQP
ncbi:MAG: FMN-binding protein [Xanthomonadales bacterium]|nr:FMN-binding protein [Xanthomonadales bacterium]